MKRPLIIPLLAALALLNLFPLLYMIGLSLHGPAAEGGTAVWFGPWMRLWGLAPLAGRWFANSAALCVLTVGFHLIADAMAGYVLAKRPFRGRNLVFVLILLAMMVPKQVTLIPLFLGMTRAGLSDSFLGLLLPGLGDAVGVFLMRQYFLSLPDSMLEAARIDGASEWRTFTMIAAPLAKPALGVLAILWFQHYWSDFFWPLVIAQSQEQYTVQVGMAFMTKTEFGRDLSLMAAGATAAAIPILAVFLLVRKQLFEGLRSGAVKA